MSPWIASACAAASDAGSDQYAAWAETRMVPMRDGWEGTEASASARQSLAPG